MKNKMVFLTVVLSGLFLVSGQVLAVDCICTNVLGETKTATCTDCSFPEACLGEVGYTCSQTGGTDVPGPVGGGTSDGSPAGGTAGGGGATLDNPLGASFEAIVKGVITAALGLTGVLALLAFIYGGLIWMISGGDSSKVKKGKDAMMWAVFGIIVIFASYAVVSFVFTALGVAAK